MQLAVGCGQSLEINRPPSYRPLILRLPLSAPISHLLSPNSYLLSPISDKVFMLILIHAR